MSRVGFRELEILVGGASRCGRQSLVELPEPRRRPVIQRARLWPALCSFTYSSARVSSFPAAESALSLPIPDLGVELLEPGTKLRQVCGRQLPDTILDLFKLGALIS